MEAGERASFNAALAKLNKLEWRDRIIAKLNRKTDVLGPPDAIALLRKIEEIL